MKKNAAMFIILISISSFCFTENWHSLGLTYSITRESYPDFDVTQNYNSFGLTAQDTFWGKNNFGFVLDAAILFPISAASNETIDESYYSVENKLTFAAYVAPMIGYKINTTPDSRVYFALGPTIGIFMELDELTYTNYYGTYITDFLFSCLDIGVASDIGYIKKISDKWCFSAGARFRSVLYRSMSVSTEDDDYDIDDFSYQTLEFTPYIAISYSNSNWNE